MVYINNKRDDEYLKTIGNHYICAPVKSEDNINAKSTLILVYFYVYLRLMKAVIIYL